VPAEAVVVDGSQREVPFARADGEAVKVDHPPVSPVVVQHVPDTGVAVDDARRQDEHKAAVRLLHRGQRGGEEGTVPLG
jgi:hypothetical protein